MMLNRSTKLVVISVVIVLLLIFLHYIKVLRPVENLVVGVTKGLLGYGYSISNEVGQKYLTYESKANLVKENEQLKEQLADLLHQKSDFTEQKDENEFLRQQLNFIKEHGFEFEIANIIGQQNLGIKSLLILNKGEKHGIIKGQPVLTSNEIMVGKIFEVERNRSFMLLINDDLSKVAAKVQNDDKTMGIVEGEFGLGLKMKLIPQTEIINEQDIVITSGLEEMVPAGLIIGAIASIEKEPEALFQQASIKSLVNFNKLTLVNIIKQKNEEN
ncbi:rod shape-determining protein MreC [Candidatus Falkowbacteria bacterium]|jgi:rod shape-determining protein MreC|nr:rod shape-determining protein MreC [Candidatus Falkowbacteria bacterium]MBT7006961.1 rod shape-determining protein MreC [Candidatus Falkowbacteria bacterium]